jgi:hypothetical protein
MILKIKLNFCFEGDREWCAGHKFVQLLGAENLSIGARDVCDDVRVVLGLIEPCRVTMAT